MSRLLQINVTANWGSTGRIAEDIGRLAMRDGWESWVAYGRGTPVSESKLIRVGNDTDMRLHALQSRLFDNHGLASAKATRRFVNTVKEVAPDVVHLHNIHGYYLNYPILFEYLKEWGGPVIWTLHDCWPFTGHCAYYDFAGCERWRSECHDCPQLRSYPASLMRDRSASNFVDKRNAFTGLSDLTFVPVSEWLDGELHKSFLGGYDSCVIHNGIDTDVFNIRPQKEVSEEGRKVVLGVASVWDRRKGLEEFVKLRERLSDEYIIILVGLSQEQIAMLPSGMTGIRRTDSIDQLVGIYNMADVFVNPTLEDNFPTTNLEALACGTPVITYDTGGSPEAVDGKCGVVVPYRDAIALADSVVEVCTKRPFSQKDCRDRAVRLYNKDEAFKQYIQLYNSLI